MSVARLSLPAPAGMADGEGKVCIASKGILFNADDCSMSAAVSPISSMLRSCTAASSSWKRGIRPEDDDAAFEAEIERCAYMSRRTADSRVDTETSGILPALTRGVTVSANELAGRFKEEIVDSKTTHKRR